MPTVKLLVELSVAIAAFLPAPQKGAIAWAPRWDDAFAQASSEKKVVFLAINMDGEAANDRLASKVYGDPRVVAAAKLTVNLVGSRFDHSAEGKPCSRFAGVECIDHKRIEGSARANVIKVDASGYTVAPQHVFLGADGKVLFSVPYEIDAAELEWCFHAALEIVDPAAAKKVDAGGRPPRRLIQGGVFDPSAIPGANLAPPTREQVLEIVKELRASMFGGNRYQNLQRLLLSPEPEAIEQIEMELKNDLFGRRGWVQADPSNANNPGDYKDRLMHAIGVLSPAAYWKMVSGFLDHDEEKLRNEAIVALEQLAAPESVSALTKALGKEKSPRLRKDLYRAIGSAGAADEKARKALLKALGSEKDPLAKRNALFALGWFAPNADSDKALLEAFTNGVAEDRSAAALAIGLSRHDAWLERLEPVAAAEQNPEVKADAEAAVSVLKGAGLNVLREPVRRACQDEINREKIFGVAQGQ